MIRMNLFTKRNRLTYLGNNLGMVTEKEKGKGGG